MRASVVVCDDCNKVAMNDMDWVTNEPGHETLVCRCGAMCFTLLELDEEFVPEGALVVEKINVNSKGCD